MRLMRLYLGFSGVKTFHHGAFDSTGLVFSDDINNNTNNNNNNRL